MSWTIVLFIESHAFDIQLTTDIGGASTNKIKPHLVLLNSVQRASTRSLRLFTRTEQIRIHIHYVIKRSSEGSNSRKAIERFFHICDTAQKKLLN